MPALFFRGFLRFVAQAGASARLAGWVGAGVAVAASLSPGDARADWPVSRHDPQRTGLATGKSDITKPAPYWRTYLGGTLNGQQLLAADINGDAKVEVVEIRGGRAVAKLANDELVWESPSLGLTALIAIVDVDGDGQLDVVGTSADHAYIIDGATGQVEWAEPDGEMGTLGSLRVADVDGDGLPELLIEECGCCAVTSGKSGFVYSFADGFQSAKLLWTLPSVDCGSFFTLTVVDTDGSGAPNVLHSSNSTLIMLDGKTGAKLAETPVVTPWVDLSLCQPVDIDGQPGDELICILNSSNPPGTNERLAMAIKYSSTPAPSLDVVWSKPLAPDAGGDVAFVNAVGDVNGDGKPDVVVSGEAAGVWTTYILDAATGDLITQLPGDRSAGSAPIGPGGAPLVLTTNGSELRGYRVQGQTPTKVFALPQQLAFFERDPARLAVGGLNQRVIATDLDGDGVADLFVENTNGVRKLSAYGLTAAQPKLVGSFELPDGVDVNAAWILPGLTQAKPQFAAARTDGFVQIFASMMKSANGDGIAISNYYASGRWGDLRGAALVGALDETATERILVHDSSGALSRIDADKATFVSGPKKRWSVAHDVASTMVPMLGATKHAIASTAQVEPVTTPPTYQIRAISPDGKVVWHVPLETVPLLDVLPGAFGATASDLVVQWGAPGDSLLRTRAVSGANGMTLWDATPVDPGAGRQPSGYAVADWNGDGKTDVVLQGPTTRVLSGVDGSVVLSGGPIAAYFLPSIYDVDGDGVPEVTLNGGFSPAQTLKHDFSGTVWAGAQDDRPFPYGAIAPCAGGPVLVEGSLAFPSRLKITRIGGATAGAAQTMVLASGRVFDDEGQAAAAGARLGQLTSASVHQNLTGTGNPTAIVGSSDGYLYAVQPCSAALQFVYEFGEPVGEAVFGDTDGDGRDEILVSVADGFLYALKNEAIAKPSFIYDVDLPHGIKTDIDDISTKNSLYCLWGPVAGAKGYKVAVADADGNFLTKPNWKDVSDTEVTLKGLTLHDGEKYFCAVQAIGDSGPSPDAVSDGVVVHLTEPPDGGATGGHGGGGGAGSQGGGGDANGSGGGVVPSGGCDCDLGGGGDAPLGLAVAALAGALALGRRRRARG